MKKAFTMIELIFVIVILGILAAVALPKFIGVASQAHEGNLKAFTGTLNRTVGPSLWSSHISSGGSITSETSAQAYVDIPKEIGKDFNFSNCGSGSYKIIVDANSTVAGGDYGIACRDGNATNNPAFRLYKGSQTVGSAPSGTCIAGPGC